MIKYEDFNEFYSNMNIDNEKILNTWQEIKAKKQKTTLIVLIIIGVLNLFILLALRTSSVVLIMTMLIMDLFICIISYMLFGNKQATQFNNEYKEKFIEKMLGNFIEDLDYIPKKGMSSNIYDEANFGGYYNKYHADDYLEGTIRNQKIIMANLLVEKEERKIDSKGHSTTETTTIFSGLFAKINLKKSINSNLSITRNYGRFLTKKQKLEMDSYEFEKKFNVFADNQIIGMQLLTADIQEDILNLYNKYKIDFHVFIYKNQMYVLFSTGRMFEISWVKKNPTEMLEKYFEIMKLIHKLVDKILKTIDETQI